MLRIFDNPDSELKDKTLSWGFMANGICVANPPQRGQQLLSHDGLGTKWFGSWATRYIGDTDSNFNGLRQTSEQDWTSNLHKE